VGESQKGRVAGNGVVLNTAVVLAGALPVVWLGVMSIFVTRLLPIFGEVAVKGFTQAWAAKKGTFADGASSEVRPKPTARQFVMIDATVVAVTVLVNVIPQSRCLASKEIWTPDLVAAGVFQSASVGGRLVQPFEWGRYAIWHRGACASRSTDAAKGCAARTLSGSPMCFP
jgi:hypothetical protein